MRYSKEEKEMRVQDWTQSGKSAWAYAREHGLNQQTFIKWTKAKKESTGELPKTCFVELQPGAVFAERTNPISPHAEILIEKGEVKIHIPLVLSRDALRAVMESLGVAV